MESPRARRMGERVADALVRVGFAPDDVSRVGRAYDEAIRPRETGQSALSSDRHPAFLHPGRTVLILIDDVGERNPRVLAAAALSESRDRALRVPEDRVMGWDVEAARLRSQIPETPWTLDGGEAEDREDADGALLEALVSCSEEVRRIALAEGLDQIRHAHLWEEPRDRARAVDLTRRVFAPMAERVDPTLARRYRWWERRVGPALSRGT